MLEPITLEDLFDDCPVCQAQKRAIEEGRDLTEDEFVEASKTLVPGTGVSGSFV